MTTIDIALARPEEKPVIANLMQLYTHDFSEHWSGMPQGEIGEDGRFADYPHLDAYWREPARVPLLLRAHGHLIGFALLNDHAHGGRAADRNMAEFFILRKYRRGGFGTAAAHAVFDLYPGTWEAAVARLNLAALAFWRKAVAGHPRVRDMEESDISTKEWNGPVIRFRIEAP